VVEESVWTEVYPSELPGERKVVQKAKTGMVKQE